MSSLPGISYIEPDELANSLRSEAGQQIVVVDVRDDDRAGGHVLGSWHCPAHGPIQSEDGLEELVMKIQESQYMISVFHCQFSQVRGPKAAMRVARKMDEICRKVQMASNGDLSKVAPSFEIKILRGGAAAFVSKYKDAEDLVEGYNSKYWE